MWDALIAYGLALAVVSTIITHTTLRIVAVVLAAVLFVAAGFNALGLLAV